MNQESTLFNRHPHREAANLEDAGRISRDAQRLGGKINWSRRNGERGRPNKPPNGPKCTEIDCYCKAFEMF